MASALFDGDEGDVVELGRFPGECAEVLLDLGEDGLGTERCGVAEGVGHALDAVFLLRAVEGLADSVGVEEHAIAGREVDLLVLGDALEDLAAIHA